jgi:glutamate synthase (NADPH) small chain
LRRGTFIIIQAICAGMGLFKRLAEKATPRSVTLYFPGCLASAKLPQVVEATKSALRDMGVGFVTLPLECCGYPAWYAGYEEEFEVIMARNKRKLADAGVARVITNCPHCALTFKERYGVETQHILELFDSNLEKIRMKEGRAASYHHPCFLDRLGVDEKVAVRVLRRAGVHVAADNKAMGCCGSVGDDFARNSPEEAAVICQRRASELQGKLLVTACPYCHVMFSRRHKDVHDVSELLGE